jgi:hypothetical protein
MQTTEKKLPARTDAKAKPAVSMKAPALDVSTIKRSLVTAVSTMSDNGQMAKIGRDGMKKLLLQCETITDYCYLIRAIERYPGAVKAAEGLVSNPEVFLRAAHIIEQAMKGGHDISELVPLLVSAAMGDNVPGTVQAAADKVLGAYSPGCRFLERPEDAAPFRPIKGSVLEPDGAADLVETALEGTSLRSALASKILRANVGYYFVEENPE